MHSDESKLRIKLALPWAIIYLVQIGYFSTVCNGSKLGIIIVTSIVLSPSLIWLIRGKIEGTVGYCLGLLPWIVIANNVECLPPHGKDAAMAYVIVFLYGVPFSLIIGFITQKIANKEKEFR